jgi:hypothetical protein
MYLYIYIHTYKCIPAARMISDQLQGRVVNSKEDVHAYIFMYNVDVYIFIRLQGRFVDAKEDVYAFMLMYDVHVYIHIDI